MPGPSVARLPPFGGVGGLQAVTERENLNIMFLFRNFLLFGPVSVRMEAKKNGRSTLPL